MKVYLAHNFAARVWLNDYVHLLELKGHECTSRWITTDVHIDDSYTERDNAEVDLSDIDSADAIIMFTDQYGETPGKGKFLELGYALAKGKLCVIYGKDLSSSVFYALDDVRHASTFREAMSYLNAQTV